MLYTVNLKVHLEYYYYSQLCYIMKMAITKINLFRITYLNFKKGQLL